MANKENPDGSTQPEPAPVSEHDYLEKRRELADLPRPVDGNRALALSGGGIRSATFSLGVLQALAECPASHPTDGPGERAAVSGFKDSLLSSFDYLSTVSGGGYIGGFLCSLFIPGRLRKQPHQGMPGADSKPMLLAADDAVKVLTVGTPGRIRSTADYSGDNILEAPLAWLRENGRYLTPTGSGDGLYAAAVGLRNWVALHLVIGSLLMAIMALLLAGRTFVAQNFPAYADWEQRLLGQALAGGKALSIEGIWWSPLSIAGLAPLLTLGVGLGGAYWLLKGPGHPHADSPCWGEGAWGALGLGLILGGLALRDPWELLTPMPQLRCLLLILSAAALFSVVIQAVVAGVLPSATDQRVAVTRGLRMVLTCTLMLLGLALVETLGQTIYLAAAAGNVASATLSPAALVLALVWMARHLPVRQVHQAPAWLKRVPLPVLAGVAGVTIFVLVGAFWTAAVHWIAWSGQPPEPQALTQARLTWAALWTSAVALAFAILIGFYPAFINLSSLQTFYAAKLARAYLGASNGARFSGNRDHRSAAEPMAGDRLRMSDYFKDYTVTTLAPLHIINVTVNKTVDPAEQLVQRDRKGHPLAVLPFGIGLDSARIQAFPNHGSRRWWRRTLVDRELDVGDWIATSGAAVSTGIGRQTSLGTSLLLGAANVRLGTWWSTGAGNSDKIRFPLLLTQRYLSYELRARFHGTQRRWQYLSDGGHFENTGIYELLRAERNVVQIFACDNGADPDYAFDDLANLIRLAKIDFHLDIRIVDPRDIDTTRPPFEALKRLFGTPEKFRTAPPARAPAALLLYAFGKNRKPVQIVLIKPRVGLRAPADVLHYAATQPPFPQQSTADQFFDEAQWESYRALGYWQGKRIFTPEVLAALEEHRNSVS